MKTVVVLLSLILVASVRSLAQIDIPTGPIKATTRVFPDGSTASTVTDPDKKTSEETMRDAGGKLIYRTVYPLNDQNFARGAIHYNSKAVVMYKEVYVFDAQGRITESKLFTKDNQPLGKRLFIYDSTNKARVEDYDKYGVLIPASSSASPKAGKRRQTDSQ